MAQQTAVEFLLSELDIAKLIEREKLTMAAEVVRQAKAMEKEQIEKAYISDRYPCSDKDAEQYYNETYGK
jgi:HEPN domain-containing protein